jgi:hypothetical protein
MGQSGKTTFDCRFGQCLDVYLQANEIPNGEMNMFYILKVGFDRTFQKRSANCRIAIKPTSSIDMTVYSYLNKNDSIRGFDPEAA